MKKIVPFYKDTTSLMSQIQNYKPWNEQEQRDKEVILERLAKDSDIFCLLHG